MNGQHVRSSKKMTTLHKTGQILADVQCYFEPCLITFHHDAVKTFIISFSTSWFSFCLHAHYMYMYMYVYTV